MGGEFGGRMDTCICMAESLLFSPETITTMLIGYNPIENIKISFKGVVQLFLNLKDKS